MPYFKDRRDAGRQLTRELRRYAGRSDVLVLALPRGGVPVAYEVAGALGAPLDVFIVRKLGMPQYQELAIGAIASGGVRVLNEALIRTAGVSHVEIEAVTAAEQRELSRRLRRYRGDRPLPEIVGRTVILIDDGLATGSTMQAAVTALRIERPAAIVVAVPTAPPETCDAFRDLVDEVVCAVTPEPFYGVGIWYQDFSQTTDEEVHELLDRARERFDGSAAVGITMTPATITERTVQVAAGRVMLEGSLGVPERAAGVVLFAHGSGSGRHSPRNRQVAEVLRARGLATLLIDLLTQDEEALDIHAGHLRFDIGLLAERLVGTIDWMEREEMTRSLPVGLFGASTGGGAALVAAARRPERVRAVVSRGGRPDLAGDALAAVRAPTLLIVGGRDTAVIRLNEEAAGRMRVDLRLEIVPGATHLFEEPGALEHVAELACDWFMRQLVRP